jgi:hypothetical protein
MHRFGGMPECPEKTFNSDDTFRIPGISPLKFGLVRVLKIPRTPVDYLMQ